MRVLVGAGLVVPKRVRGWTFYKRDEACIRAAVDAIRDGVRRPRAATSRP